MNETIIYHYMSKLRDDIRDLRDKMNALERRLDSANQEIKKLRSDMANLKQKVSSIQEGSGYF